MPDRQIHPIGDEPAPADYTIPGSAELLLKSVHAHFDGSGAAGSFVPLVRIISDAGSTTDEIPQDVTVAAGASADATWFPHVGGGGGAATTNAEWFIARRTTTLNMAASTTTTIPWSDLNSSDSSLFSLTTVSNANDGVLVSGQGVVFMTGWLIPDPLPANFVVGLLLNSSNGVSLNTNTPNNQFGSKSMPGTQPHFGPTQGAIVIPDTVPYHLTMLYHNDDVANHNLQGAHMWGLYWPTGVLSPF
jgi:hypothetical protein